MDGDESEYQTICTGTFVDFKEDKVKFSIPKNKPLKYFVTAAHCVYDSFMDTEILSLIEEILE